MNFRRLLYPSSTSTPADLALLVLRLVCGIAFAMHGWGKIQHPFSWMGDKAFAPAPMQALAAIAEFGGGLAWVVGLLVPLASFGIACTMVVAVYSMVVMYHAPFVSQTGGMSAELPSVFLCVALVLMTVGPGRLSLDYLLFGRPRLGPEAADLP